MSREPAPAQAWPEDLVFGDLLRRLRLEAELSQEALAERARISLEAVSALERGTRKAPQRETVVRLAEGLALGGESRAAFERAAARGRTPRPLGGRAAAEPVPRAATNLPLQVSSFVARDEELAALERVIARSRLVTLTGAAGVGKTRTALQVASRMQQRLADGVWFVDLAPLANSSLVVAQIAAALGVACSGDAAFDDVTAYLRHKTLLLVLDDCEHVVTEAARVAEAIVRACERVTVLATSRERLNVPGETLFRLPSLSVPPAGAMPSPSDAMGFGAVRLFVERAGGEALDQSGDGFVLTERNAGAVVEICRRLDGIPLAIELAAARVRTLPLATIEAKLEERFELLKGGSRTALPKHQTLRAAIEWSYALLAEPEQRLFEWLAPFAGYPELEVLTSACAAAEESARAGLPAEEFAVLEIVSALADKSLVEVSRSDESVRYGLLDSTRRFAREKLRVRGLENAAAQAHALAMLELAEGLDEIQPATPDLPWYARATRELDDWRLALEWSLHKRNDVVVGQRLAAALQFAWTGTRNEGHQWIQLALETCDEATSQPVAARLELANAYFLIGRGRAGDALSAASSARARYELLADRFGVAWCDDIMGLAHVGLGSYELGEAELHRALESARASGAEKLASYALQDLALLHQMRGDLENARRLHAETLEAFERTGDERARAVALAHLSDLERRAGDLEAALRFAYDARAEDERLGRVFSAAQLSCAIVSYLLAMERCGDAAAAAADALRRASDYRDDSLVALAVHQAALVSILVPRSEPKLETAERGARLLGFSASNLRGGEEGATDPEQAQRARALLRERLGAERAGALEPEGAAWRADRALGEATRAIDATLRDARSVL